MSDDNEKRIAEIRARLNAATPGPWVEDDGNVFDDATSKARYDAIIAKIDGRPYDDAAVRKLGLVATCDQAWENFDNNALFIAHAPADIAFMLSEVERLRAEIRDDGEKP
jgi:hypothetical protein